MVTATPVCTLFCTTLSFIGVLIFNSIEAQDDGHSAHLPLLASFGIVDVPESVGRS